jgi:hypothetical protein
VRPRAAAPGPIASRARREDGPSDARPRARPGERPPRPSFALRHGGFWRPLRSSCRGRAARSRHARRRTPFRAAAAWFARPRDRTRRCLPPRASRCGPDGTRSSPDSETPSPDRASAPAARSRHSQRVAPRVSTTAPRAWATAVRASAPAASRRRSRTAPRKHRASRRAREARRAGGPAGYVSTPSSAAYDLGLVSRHRTRSQVSLAPAVDRARREARRRAG